MSLVKRRGIVAAALVIGIAGTASAQESKVDGAAAAAKASPTSLDAQLAYGRVLRRAGRTKEAVTVLQRATTLGAAAGAVGDPARYELMRAQADAKQHDGAMRACSGIKNVALRHACFAEVHVTIKKRGTEAEPEVAKAIQADPSLYEAKYVEGITAALEGDAGLAEAALSSATKIDPKRPDAFLALARLFEASRREADALVAAQSALAVAQDDPMAEWAVAHLVPPGPDAQAIVERITKDRPSFGPAWARLSEVYMAENRADDAANAAEKAVKLDPQQPDWHADLAVARNAQKRWDDALASVKAAIAIQANHGRARLAEGDALAGKGDIDQAIAAYQASFGALRTDPAPLVHGAAACLAQGRETTAKGFADRVTHEFPKWGPGWDVAGDVAAKAGDKEAARAAWEKALASEGPIDAAAIRAKLASAR